MYTRPRVASGRLGGRNNSIAISQWFLFGMQAKDKNGIIPMNLADERLQSNAISELRCEPSAEMLCTVLVRIWRQHGVPTPDTRV